MNIGIVSLTRDFITSPFYLFAESCEDEHEDSLLLFFDSLSKRELMMMIIDEKKKISKWQVAVVNQQVSASYEKQLHNM